MCQKSGATFVCAITVTMQRLLHLGTGGAITALLPYVPQELSYVTVCGVTAVLHSRVCAETSVLDQCEP